MTEIGSVSSQRSASDTCRALRSQLGFVDGPRDLGRVAKRFGLSEIRLADLPVDGLLVRGPKGRSTAVINRNISPTRKRYTLAHEVGHMVLGTTGAHCSATPHTPSQAERDADAFAAELLMPRDVFAHAASSLPPGMKSIVRLSREFLVSFEAAAIRTIETGSWRAVLISWAVKPRPGGTTKLRVDWSAKPPDSRVYVPRYAPASSALADVASAEGTVRTQLKIDTGNLRGTFDVDVRTYADRVLSLILLSS